VVDDCDRAWWLQRFGDAAIATMTAAMTGRVADLERIASERQRLAGALALPPACEP
jgi:hypothetical protein